MYTLSPAACQDRGGPKIPLALVIATLYTENVMKFATKLLLAISGTVLVGAITLVTIAGDRIERLLEGQLVARLEDNAYHMLEKLDQYWYERRLDAKAMMADPALIAATASPEQAAGYLRELLRWRGLYLSAAFYTMEWEVVADTADRRAGVQEALDGCRADLETGVDFAICAGRDAPEDEPTIRIACVARVEGKARGVVVLRLPMQLLEDHLRLASVFRGAEESLHVDLVDDRGVVLYSSYEREGILREVSPDWRFVKERMRVAPDSSSMRYVNPAEKTGEEILVYVREQGFRDFTGSAWTLILFVPTEAAFAPVRVLRLKIAAVPLFTSFALLSVLILLVRSFTRPIEELGRAAQEIGRGNLEVRVSAGSRDELGLLAETFNTMAANLQESHRELAAFSRDLEGLVEERTAELLRTNVLLHAELSERVKAQEALAERELLLRLGADIGEALTREQKLEATLQQCTDFIARDLDAVLVRIWVLGGEKDVLELKASAGLCTRIDGKHSRKIVGELKIGVIAKEQRPILTNALVGDAGIVDQEWVRREGIASFAGYPLVVDHKTVGVLALFARRPLEQHVLAALAIAADRVALYLGRKGVEGALRESEKRYRDLFESSIDGIYAVNAEGIFTSMNRAGAQIFGHESADEIVGRPVLDYWRDPRSREVFMRELKVKKALSAYPIKAQKKNGELLEIESSARIVEDAAGRALGDQGVVRDVTERVRSEAERELLLAQLQEAARNIRNLSGLLPICSGCKKIRDDKGSWRQIETYIKSHSEVEFTHGLCPECQKVYFPGRGART